LRSRLQTEELFLRHKPTHVLHMATKTGGIFDHLQSRVEYCRENVLMNDNIMECCRLHRVKKLVTCLSAGIFPANPSTFPVDEKMIHDGPPHPTFESLAFSNRLVDVMNRAYAEQYGCRFTSVIPTNIYGPFFGKKGGHVADDLVRRCITASRNGSPTLVVYGSGAPLRQFVYSRDLAKLLVWAVREYDDTDPIDLTVDEEISIGDLARTIAAEVGYDGEIMFDTSKPDGRLRCTVSNAKLRGLLPDFQFTLLNEGIRETAAWFKEHFEDDDEKS